MWEAIAAEASVTMWAISPTVLDSMLGKARAGIVAIGPRKLPRVSGNVAVIPISGMISQRSSIWQEIFGGTSTEQLTAATRAAVNDSRIKAIIYDVDSPGGTVSGVQDAADAINEAAGGDMPIAAVTNSQNASAAYWLSSQVGAGRQRLTAARGSYTGSIGVFRMHVDYSGALEQDGVKVTFISTPEYKVEGNPYEPMSAEAISFEKGQIDEVYNEFVNSVARGRGVNATRVKESFGKGRMFSAETAASMGIVDRVASLPDLLTELGAGDFRIGDRVSAEAQHDLCQVWENCEPIQTESPKRHNLQRERELNLRYRQ